MVDRFTGLQGKPSYLLEALSDDGNDEAILVLKRSLPGLKHANYRHEGGNREGCTHALYSASQSSTHNVSCHASAVSCYTCAATFPTASRQHRSRCLCLDSIMSWIAKQESWTSERSHAVGRPFPMWSDEPRTAVISVKQASLPDGRV